MVLIQQLTTSTCISEQDSEKEDTHSFEVPFNLKKARVSGLKRCLRGSKDFVLDVEFPFFFLTSDQQSLLRRSQLKNYMVTMFVYRLFVTDNHIYCTEKQWQPAHNCDFSKSMQGACAGSPRRARYERSKVATVITMKYWQMAFSTIFLSGEICEINILRKCVGLQQRDEIPKGNAVAQLHRQGGIEVDC